MTAIRWQGLAFCLLSAFAIVFQKFIGRFDPVTELSAVAIIIAVLGVPHGALDIVFAQQMHKVRTPFDWLLFGLAYATPVMAVVAIWYWAPLVFLVGFLVISAAHFSGDPESGTPVLVRVLYGGAPIILPTCLYAGEVKMLFAILTDVATATQVVGIMSLVAFPWLAGLAIAAIFQWRQTRVGATEIVAVSGVCCFMPPLLGFALFFCAMHSARHILRATAQFPTMSVSQLFQATVVPMFITFIIIAGCWLLLGEKTVSQQIIQLLFVGLAAVTVPHMGLIDAPWKSMGSIYALFSTE